MMPGERNSSLQGADQKMGKASMTGRSSGGFQRERTMVERSDEDGGKRSNQQFLGFARE